MVNCIWGGREGGREGSRGREGGQEGGRKGRGEGGREQEGKRGKLIESIPPIHGGTSLIRNEDILINRTPSNTVLMTNPSKRCRMFQSLIMTLYSVPKAPTPLYHTADNPQNTPFPSPDTSPDIDPQVLNLNKHSKAVQCALNFGRALYFVVNLNSAATATDEHDSINPSMVYTCNRHANVYENRLLQASCVVLPCLYQHLLE